MANTDLIVTKLRAKYSDALNTFAGDSFGDLWHLWSMEEASDPYLVGEALLDVYGGTGTFGDREFAYWTAFDPGDTGFDAWTPDVVNTVDNTVTITRSLDGSYQLTGTGAGAGNDRRIYYKDGTNVTDVEARLTFEVGGGVTGLGQTGIALRGADNGPAVIAWSNIVFAATGNVINGIWQYDGTTLQSTNQLANSNRLWGPDIINGSGSGTLVTVNTDADHRALGHILGFTGFGSFSGTFTAVDAPTADQFRFGSTVTGSWTGGNFEYIIATQPRHLAVRLVGSTMTTKQWLVGHPEPEWNDPVRAEVNTIPGTLAVGGVSAPASGLAGIVVAHLGNGSFIRVRDFTITEL